jgi:hypothetical protein
MTASELRNPTAQVAPTPEAQMCPIVVIVTDDCPVIRSEKRILRKF